MPRMKVLIISSAFPPLKSGGADYVLKLCSELASCNLEVHCLTNISHAAPASANFHLHPIMRNWRWSEFPRCLQFIRRLNPDVVDIHFTGWVYHDHPMITFLPAAIRLCTGTQRIITHLESLGGVDRARSSVITAAVRRLLSVLAGRKGINYEYGTILRDSNTIVVLNERDRGELCKFAPDISTKCELIPPPPIASVTASPVDRTALRHSLGLTTEDLVLAYYGYIYPGKGLETLFESLSKIRNAIEPYKLLLIGTLPESYVLVRASRPNYLAELKEMSNRLHISTNLIWEGYSEPESLRPSQLIHSCDFAVLPFERGVMLNNSSFSFVAAHGKPVISTKGLHTEAAFQNGTNVLLVPPNDAESMARAIVKLKTDEGLRNRLSEGATTMAENCFSWELAIAKTIKAYQP